MRSAWAALLALATLLILLGWSLTLEVGPRGASGAAAAQRGWQQLRRQDWPALGGSENIRAWEQVPELNGELAIFRSVFWAPEDTESLRQQIAGTPLVHHRRVLEIGTGSGLVALCCLQAGAEYVLATDVNSAALANAWYNAQRLQLADRLELRLVSPQFPQAFAVMHDHETFDIIVSNPPWENQQPSTVEDAAFYDPDFVLLRSLLRDARRHLRPGGKVLLAYGCVEAIRHVESEAPHHGFVVRRLDDRELNSLPEVFVPGMLLELTLAPR